MEVWRSMELICSDPSPWKIWLRKIWEKFVNILYFYELFFSWSQKRIIKGGKIPIHIFPLPIVFLLKFNVEESLAIHFFFEKRKLWRYLFPTIKWRDISRIIGSWYLSFLKYWSFTMYKKFQNIYKLPKFYKIINLYE